MINKYSKFLSIRELASYYHELSNYQNYLNDIEEPQSLFKECIFKINSIIEKVKKLEILNFTKTKNENEYRIDINDDLELNFVQLDKALKKLSKVSDELYDNLFYKYLSIEFDKSNLIIEIEKNSFNRIHLPNELPYFLKGIGFGNTIYRSAIQQFGWISSNEYMDSISKSAKMVWSSISKDNNYYTFMTSDDIITFSKDTKFEDIVNILNSMFYDRFEDVIPDKDFHIKYRKEIENSEIKQIFKKCSNIGGKLF